jgi:polysaccharide biosynthesis/export protein
VVLFVVSAYFGCVCSIGQAQPAPTETPRAGGHATAVSPDYVIGPGDALEVFVWRNPDLSTKVPVRPDGKISTPLVEDMVAVGKTPTQLARDIEKVLTEFIRSPTVNVIVTAPLGVASQVIVAGEAARPAAIPYSDGLTVLQAIIAVGGLSQYAAGNRAKVVRQSADGKHQTIPVKLHDLLDKGDISQNLTLAPGDVIFIPQTVF